jgi:hypothetical protein
VSLIDERAGIKNLGIISKSYRWIDGGNAPYLRGNVVSVYCTVLAYNFTLMRSVRTTIVIEAIDRGEAGSHILVQLYITFFPFHILSIVIDYFLTLKKNGKKVKL